MGVRPTSSQIRIFSRLVLTLTQPLEGLHHHIITDRFYSSPELASELEKRGLAFTGTVQVNRRGMPQAIKGGRKLSRGTVQAYRSGKMMALQWQDKRPITMLSTTESCNMVQVKTRRGQMKEKPQVVQLYNNNMMGVDRHGVIVVFVAARVRGEQRHTSVLHAPTTPTCTQENVSEYITLADHVLEQIHSPCCLYWFTRCICSSLSPYLAVPSLPYPFFSFI